MSSRSMVLNFSGNDSAGFAGMAMDVRTQVAMGVHSGCVVTANTAQNNQCVISVNPVDNKVFGDQLAAVSDMPVQAVKAGLLATADQIVAIADYVAARSLPLVLDPVLKSSSDSAFLNSDLILVLKQQLLPHCTLLTPNVNEAEVLSDHPIQSPNDLVKVAELLLALGVKSVLIKGGHFNGGSPELVQDYFSDGQRSFWLTAKKIGTDNLRGTGCALSSAIASALALGYSLYDAIVIGKMAVSQGLRYSYGLNTETGPVSIQRFPDDQTDLPVLTGYFIEQLHEMPFPECNQPLLGLYPVVDRAAWIETLAPAGVSTIQLRIKDLSGSELENEIETAVQLARKLHCRLFINDYWQLAIRYQAYGVHLGQEDLDAADISQLRQAGLRLGISTHCHYEVARAHAYSPSYMACGPVYHTNTKQMPWVPHGVEGLSYWRRVLRYPLVAIGGINQSRFSSVKATGVDSIAMITAITHAENPAATAAAFVNQLQVTGDD